MRIFKFLPIFLVLFFSLFSEIPQEELQNSLQAHIHPNPEGENSIGKLKIDDRSSGISESTWIYVKNGLDYYKKQKQPPLFIILELNTPGGEVFAAQKISDALKDLDTQYNIPVVAFINNWAISAGAMLAYSCRYIAAVKDGSMGAAEPILQDGSGETKTASEKVNSAIRADFASRAHFFDRNPLIAEAMVDKDMILVKRLGKIIALPNENQIEASDIVISPKGKLLTLSTEELMQYGVADFALKPERRPQITEEEASQGKWPAAKEPLFQVPFFALIPHAVIDEYQMDWKTRFFALLAHPMAASALILGLMLGIYMEFNHPGLTLPGLVAGCCLFLIALSSFSAEIGSYLELILLLTGVLLLIVDLFFLPTFGLLGGLGVLLFLGGLFGLILPGVGSVQYEWDTQTFNAAGEALLYRLGWVLATLVIGGCIIAILARYVVSSSRFLKRLILEGDEQVGYTAGTSREELPKIHAEGTVIATLRPSGKVEIGGNLYDAAAERGLIEKGSKITVINYDGSTLIVRGL
jgi:membrane-bound serine protease (ClpP class)